MTNERSDSLLQAQFRAVQATASRREPQDEANPVSQVLTGLMRHGGVYSLTDPEIMAARMAPIMMSTHSTSGGPHFVTEAQLTPKQIASFVSSVSSTAASFFQHLVQDPTGKDLSYAIPSSLMSHIAFPISGSGTAAPPPPGAPTTPATGVCYRDPAGGPEGPIPAAFTFVGQFIDHDLTMNAVNLFEPQTGDVHDTASPLIDLDSVYGPRSLLTNPAGNPSKKVYNPDGSFKLTTFPGPNGTTYVDLPRDTHGNAFINDKRNDENQMLLQVHLLVMRLHNKLISNGLSLADAYKETLFNWQSVLLTDYLPRILDPNVLADLRVQIDQPDFGTFKYKPCRDLTDGRLIASMPHEFAIGFRFGHSQLKSKYQLSTGGALIPLFDNSLTSKAGPNVNSFDDLRGSQQLAPDHVIEWPFFAATFKGNSIDSHVTPIVADLPESTIPDDIKYIGNLVHRNLIRSRQVGLCAGEDLAAFYLGNPHEVPPNVIEPDPAAHHLYKQHGHFRTPLWFYLLREAEHAGSQSRLGKVGSHLVGEVILGAIKWAPESVLNNPGWTSTITTTRQVSLLDIAGYV